MNRIRENLRFDFSRPWAVWALLGGAVGVYWLLVLLEILGVWGRRFGPMPLSWWWAQVLIFGGIAAGSADRHDALGLPFSFILPGYRESLRGASLIRAARWGVVFALLAFSQIWVHPQLLGVWPSEVPKPAFMTGPSAAEISLTMVGGFLVGMATCLAWVNSQLIWYRRRWFAILLIGVPIAMDAAAIFHGERHPLVVWPILISLSAVFCGFFWWRLGDMEWVKSGHRGVLTRKTRGLWGIEVQTAVFSCTTGGLHEVDGRATVSSWMEALFRDGRRKGGFTAGARYVWGSFYRVFGPIFAQWKWIVVSLFAGVLVLGYVNRVSAGIAFAFLGMHVAGGVWSASSTMLLPEGRREKYYLTLAAGAVATLLLTTVSAGVIALSWLFAALLPTLSLGTYHLQYTGLSMRNVWLACLPVPWFPIVLLVMALIVVSVRLVLPFLILLAVLLLVVGGVPRVHASPSLLPILLACGWVFFPSIMWIKYRRWDLAGQGAMGAE